jgi:hypothetical protein
MAVDLYQTHCRETYAEEARQVAPPALILYLILFRKGT